MKYGDSLRQRSIPLWETYNIDYNDIKRLIKIHTSNADAKPTPIPGKESPADRTFEHDLEDELRSQHQRIDLFVQSKAGEIARRLLHLEKQVAQLKRRTAASPLNAISVRRLEKFARLEEEILKAGEEIQSLSRFVGAQRLAFQKLLKKYKKWTGSSRLGERFQKEVLDRPASFSKRDFAPLLTQWTDVLADVRDSFDAGVLWQVDSPDIAASANPARRRASDQGDSLWGQKGSANDFDAAFAISHLVHGGGKKASYWVHPDNLVELHVLLLQYTRLQTSSEPPSSRSSAANSITSNGASSGTKIGDEIGVFICEDLQWFAKSRSSATISESMEGAAASIRYSSPDEAVIVIETACQDVQPDSRQVQASNRPGSAFHIHKTKLKKKTLRRLFEPGTPSPKGRSESHSSDGSRSHGIPGEGRICNAVQIWQTQHRDVRPLVQIQMRRTRFVGLGNTPSAGILATLDKDILIRNSSLDAFRGNEDLFTINEGAIGTKTFPHAVLDIRYDGEESAEIINALDRSHLTERVHGFSLGTHAVASLCQPQGMAPPIWFPVLDNDIRKLPAPVRPRDRRYASNSNAQTNSTEQTSLSTPSTADGPTGSGFSGPMIESPPTSVCGGPGDSRANDLKKKQRQSPAQREHPLRVQTNLDSPPQQQLRYWNEFDDGDEGSSDEVYTVFVDPTSSSGHLGARMMAGIRAWGNKATSWLKSAPQPPSPDCQPLMGDDFMFGQSSPEGDETDLENSFTPSRHAHRPRAQRNYSAIQNPSISASHAPRHNPQYLPGALVAFFTASSIFLLVATVLVVVGFQNAVEISMAYITGVVICVVESLVFCMLGLGTLLTASYEQRSGIPMVTVGLSFVLECLCGSVLLVVALNGS